MTAGKQGWIVNKSNQLETNIMRHCTNGGGGVPGTLPDIGGGGQDFPPIL